MTIERADPDELVRSYWPLLLSIAVKRHRRLPGHIELDDVIGDGALGLLDAARRWDPDLGKFSTFATHRISGAILDGLRRTDHLSRSSRRTNDGGERWDIPVSTDLMADEGWHPSTTDDGYADVELREWFTPAWRDLEAARPRDAETIRLAAQQSPTIAAADRGITESGVSLIRKQALSRLRSGHPQPHERRQRRRAA